ncbi:MAG: arginine deiminase family protein [Candidatus Aminicenantes bacterium]|nr:arginine deiminase family protein [Candidatus Aminicenantes bacterium]
MSDDLCPGAQSEVAAVRSLLLKHPRDAWLGQDNVSTQWRALNYAAEPDFGRAMAEYDAFVELLRTTGPDIRFLPADPRTGLDSLYVRDAAVATSRGLILGRMGKELRSGEPEAVREYCARSGLPVLGAVEAPGTLEGGDVVWLDERTLLVGRGYRTNADGIRQLHTLTAGLVDEFIEVPLPHWRGPGDVLHLMSLLSPVEPRTLLVYPPLLPVPFLDWLRNRGLRLLNVPDEEFDSLGCNVLALGSRACIALGGNPRTRKILESAGLEVLVYAGHEISFKGAGGPTCLTRPLVRE